MNEPPGTYFWHGHSGAQRMDGLYGPLIVRPRVPVPEAFDEEIILLLSDNYHGQADALFFGLNR